MHIHKQNMYNYTAGWTYMRKQNIIRADECTYASEILYGRMNVHINEAGEALGGGAVHATISSYYHNGSVLDGILGTRASMHTQPIFRLSPL